MLSWCWALDLFTLESLSNLRPRLCTCKLSHHCGTRGDQEKRILRDGYHFITNTCNWGLNLFFHFKKSSTLESTQWFFILATFESFFFLIHFLRIQNTLFKIIWTRWVQKDRDWSPLSWEKWKWKKVKSLSHVWLFVTPWTITCQAPLFMGFSRQEYWSGLPFLSPGDLPDTGIKPRSPALQAHALPSEPPGKPELQIIVTCIFPANQQPRGSHNS